MSSSLENSQSDAADWTHVHPDFDGHLEVPLEKMTTRQKLEWLWQMVEFQHLIKTRGRMLPPGSAGERGRDDRS